MHGCADSSFRIFHTAFRPAGDRRSQAFFKVESGDAALVLPVTFEFSEFLTGGTLEKDPVDGGHGIFRLRNGCGGREARFDSCVGRPGAHPGHHRRL